MRCSACGESLETPLVCSACGRLHEAPEGATPFLLLGIAPGFALDEKQLQKKLFSATRRMHPDFFGGAAPEERALAERNTAELNSAHRLLSNDYRRADWLLRSLGGPDEKAEREMPRAFLMEVLEWNEALEAARESQPGSPERAALASLGTELRGRRSEVIGRAGDAIDTALSDDAAERDAAALTEVRRLLNAVRYLDRALDEMESLRLAQASTR
jgi:molecular chaperone HscB